MDDLADEAAASAGPSRQQPAHPRPRRTSSLPRTFYSPQFSTSIFGRTSPIPSSQNPEPRPSLSFSPPSHESLPALQPPLSTLSDNSRAQASRQAWYQDATEDNQHFSFPGHQLVEKEGDDPTSPPTTVGHHQRHESTTLTTLSRLFAVHAATSPDVSRSPSFNLPPRHLSTYARNLQFGQVDGLPDHLYSRGLLQGRHSDITVRAFGQDYQLHRIILDRAPFFRSALSEPWLESTSRETTVHPEDIDTSITQASFELALKRLYGCSDPVEESRDAVGLFATGCWLEMQDLIESSVESMLRQMSPETLGPLVRLVTTNYYGRAGDKILASAKAMLCRYGWSMPVRFWDGIPGDIVREIVGGDGFYIEGEWERWKLAKTILNRRLKARALEAGLVEPGGTKKVMKAPDTANLMAVRFDTVYRRNGMGSGRGMPDSLHRWVSLYTHPEVEPLLVLLDEGIHYIHLDFEQLQFIKDTKDVLGLPVLPHKVIGDALWQQMELRQRVMNAHEDQMELGISVTCADDTSSEATRNTTMNITTPLAEPVVILGASNGKGKAAEESSTAETVHKAAGEDDLDSNSWDGNGKPRKFWIPTSDCNIVMGGNADPIIATSNTTTLQQHASRLSATLLPEDIRWASDFSAITAQARPTSGEIAASYEANAGANGDVRYTHFPPFRFAAEFPNPRLLKERKRVYSRTVFYAGSLWNIYIQKVATSRSKQLGVYLHRAEERDTEDAGTAGLAQGSVDERIGMLEREMILRTERRERRHGLGAGVDGIDAEGRESSENIDSDAAHVNTGRPGLMRDLLARTRAYRSTPRPSVDDATDSDDDNIPTKRPQVPTLPSYVDARPKIKTYFKIYSPSRGGRMLSVYESAPGEFKVSQSWGWKSSTLMLKDGLGGEDGEMEGEEAGGEAGKSRGDSKLRFMVVIGNI